MNEYECWLDNPTELIEAESAEQAKRIYLKHIQENIGVGSCNAECTCNKDGCPDCDPGFEDWEEVPEDEISKS